MMAELIESLAARSPAPGCPELATLGRPLKRRMDDTLAFLDREHSANGPTETINGRLETLRGIALGFRNLGNHTARSPLHTGGFRQAIQTRLCNHTPTHQNRKSLFRHLRIGRIVLRPSTFADERPSLDMPCVERLAVFAVNGDDQAPATAHVRAVHHHHMMPDHAWRDDGMDVPTLGGALAQGANRRTGRSPPAAACPAARRGTRPSRAHARPVPAASSNSTSSRDTSTVGRPSRSCCSSSSPDRRSGISSSCWISLSCHPAHHPARPQAGYCPAIENNQPTRLLPQDQTPVISTTEAPP